MKETCGKKIVSKSIRIYEKHGSFVISYDGSFFSSKMFKLDRVNGSLRDYSIKNSKNQPFFNISLGFAKFCSCYSVSNITYGNFTIYGAISAGKGQITYQKPNSQLCHSIVHKEKDSNTTKTLLSVLLGVFSLFLVLQWYSNVPLEDVQSITTNAKEAMNQFFSQLKPLQNKN